MQLAAPMHGRSLVPAAGGLQQHTARQLAAVCRAGKARGAGGFDSKSTKKKTTFSDGFAMTRDRPKRIRADDLGDDGGSKAAKPSAPKDLSGWSNVCKVSDFVAGKSTKPVILACGKSVMLYKVGSRLFCSDAESTAYKYPLVDAKVSQQGEAVVVEVPLDGTQYDLRTGEVLTWCPRDNPVRNLLGTLKKDTQPTPLKVYETYVAEDQTIWVRFTV